MFELRIDDVDAVVLRRIILTYATDLEQTQAKVESEDHLAMTRIDEKAFRFIDYAQQLGQYAEEQRKINNV